MTMTFNTTLRHSQDLLGPALRAAVQRMDPTNAALTSYHLGWTDADGKPTGAAAGKAMRPALALLSARATGASAEVGLPGAVAVELVHNFSLLHDDVMDGDTLRRHRPTVWAIWGVPSAILAGDAMLTEAQATLLDSGSPRAVAALRLLTDATRELIRGQVEDVQFESRGDVSLQACQAMAAGKTGALLAASASIGAVLAGASENTVAALARYGQHVGAAFQLVDDVLGIWGEPSVTGKPVLSDLRRRKKTLPVSYALSRGGAAGRELAEWLASDDPVDEASLQRAADLVEAGGGRRWAVREAERQMRIAEQSLETVSIVPEVRAELVALACYVVTRNT